jgi:hypothetical protein
LKKLFFCFGLFLALLTVFAGAVASENHEITITVSEAQQLVRVVGDFNYSEILPGFDYERPIVVEWNVPDNALQAQAPNGITIYGRISTTAKNGDAWISFKRSPDSRARKSLSFKLYCNVQGGQCSTNSKLSENFLIVLNKPANALEEHYEQVLVNASLSPLPLTEEEKKASALSDEIAVTAAEAAQLDNESAAFASEVNGALDTARNALKLDDYEFAEVELKRAQSKLLEAQQQMQDRKREEEARKAEQEKNDWLTGLFAAGKSEVYLAAALLVIAAFATYYFYARNKEKGSLDDVVLEAEKEEGLGKKAPFKKL